MHQPAVWSAQPVSSDNSDASPTSPTLETAVQKRLDSISAGNYRRSVRAGLNTFSTWCVDQPDIETLDDITRTHLYRWVEDPDAGLRARIDSEQLSPRTAHQYYAYVRASFTWWVNMGYCQSNPAKNADAEGELPKPTNEPDRQYWDAQSIQRVVNHASGQVDESLEDGIDRDAILAMRDRAIVLLLAHSGARGAELFRDPNDDKRNGITWADLDWERGLIQVLGKTREPELAQLWESIQPKLKRYQDALEPASAEWPVIPSLDHASLHRRVRTVLGDRGWAATDIEAALETDPLAVCRTHSICLPALSVRSARAVMRRLCADAGVDIDGEYLKPHGGRRGLGNRLYDEDPGVAQDTLRHKSIRTTNDAYREQQAAQTRQRAEYILHDNES